MVESRELTGVIGIRTHVKTPRKFCVEVELLECGIDEEACRSGVSSREDNVVETSA